MASSSTAAASVAEPRLFPLHLTPIESFMLTDDRPGYPMTYVIQLQLAGQIDRPAWEAALGEALDRHPVLRAIISPGKRNLPCWTLAGNSSPVRDWGSEGTPITLADGEGIDLANEPGLRVWVRQGPSRAVVVLQFHHASTDGTGAYRFIGDVLAGYGIRTATADQRPEFGTLDPGLLRGRRQRMLGDVAGAPWKMTQLAIRQGWKILSRWPAVLASPPPKTETNPTDFPGFLSLSMDRPEHTRVRDAAGRGGVTLNDLLLRDLFLTLDAWNAQRSPSRRRWLRIMMPTDLRGSEDYEMSATNMVSYTFLARAARDLAVSAELLRTIRNETAQIKHERAGTAFLDMVIVASKVPGLLPFILSSRICLATATLSNVADPSRRFTARFPRQSGRIVAGNLVLEEITGVPPLRPKTSAAVSVSQYDRRLTISLRCDPHRFRMEDTGELLGLYMQRLRESAESITPLV